MGMKGKLLVAGFAVTLAAMAIGPDLVAWVSNGRPAPFVRAFTNGDQDYYADRLHRTILAGAPAGNPYFWEHRDVPSRFALFEWAAAAASPIKAVIGTDASLWHDLVRLVSVMLTWLLLATLLSVWALPSRLTALATAFAVMAFWGAYRSQEWYALETWFMPFHLLGLWFARQALESRRPLARVIFGLLAALSFSTHPFAFAVGTGGLGLTWLARSRSSWRSAIVPFVTWAALALTIGLAFFGWHAAGTDDAAREALIRAPLIMSHRPLNAVIMAGAAGVLCLVLACRRRFSRPEDQSAWDLLAGTLGIVPVIGFSNLATGRYFVLDHSEFLVVPLAVLAAALVFGKPAQRAGDRVSRALAWIGACLVLVYGIDLLIHTSIRAFLVLGTYLPYFTAAGTLAAAALMGGALKIPRAAVAFLLIAAALYPSVFLWRVNRHDAPRHERAQGLGPVLSKLQELPPGVVMSDGEIAEQVARHTPHYTYWTQRAWIDQATDAELLARWRGHLVFFQATMPEVPTKDVVRGLRGLKDKACGIVPTASASCPEAFADEKEAEAYIARLQQEARQEAATAFRPPYRLDYLVLDAVHDERLPDAFAVSFEEIWTDGRFTIFRYLKTQ
jgi:hypothetical protein